MKRFLLCLLFGLFSEGAFAADEPTGIEFFEKKIRPVLVQRCYECHAADAKASRAHAILLTPYSAILDCPERRGQPK